MLVAEDREEDIEILKIACAKAKVTLPLHFVRNGVEAIEYLNGQGRYVNRRLPTLLLLDINMPLLNGFEVLQWLRCQPRLRRLLVIVFTSSSLTHDVNRAFDLGANSYLVKPSDMSELEQIARSLQDYWVKLNRHPDCAGPAEAIDLASAPRVLLRNPETLLYFRGANTWTEDPNQALNFQRPETALQWAHEMSLRRFELVVDKGEVFPGGRG